MDDGFFVSVNGAGEFVAQYSLSSTTPPQYDPDEDERYISLGALIDDLREIASTTEHGFIIRDAAELSFIALHPRSFKS